ncbi:MAG: MaoC family dehydratase [Steroidobacteraceae bacterium]
MIEDLDRRARLRAKGFWFEDFTVGRVFEHHWGRTLTQAENALFTTLTLHFNPIYTNIEYAKALGHDEMPLNPLLVFNTIFGLSVEDLSENGVAFLGVDDLLHERSAYPGDTLYARSTVVDSRVSAKKPATGIVTWRTEGSNQRGERVCAFTRSNLLLRREPQLAAPGSCAS